jgi:hypothetical protein
MCVRGASGEREVPTEDTTILYPVSRPCTIGYVDLTSESRRGTLGFMDVRIGKGVMINVCDRTCPSLGLSSMCRNPTLAAIEI